MACDWLIDDSSCFRLKAVVVVPGALPSIDPLPPPLFSPPINTLPLLLLLPHPSSRNILNWAPHSLTAASLFFLSRQKECLAAAATAGAAPAASAATAAAGTHLSALACIILFHSSSVMRRQSNLINHVHMYVGARCSLTLRPAPAPRWPPWSWPPPPTRGMHNRSIWTHA